MKLPSKKILLSATGSALLLGYAGGFLSQILNGYAVWRESGGIPGSGTSPPLPSLSPAACLRGLLTFPYGLYGLLLCGGTVVLLILYRRLSADSGEYDIDRNFTYASSGTYGTSGWMTRQELSGVLELVHDLRGHTGTVLGMLGSEIVCVPEKSRLNRNIAVYGVSGSMKTRSYCLNRILQGVAAGESLVINDPKSELYETTSEYLATKGYIVRVFNLVSPDCSDAWNCLEEVDGQELNAQLFVEVVIKNTQGNSKGDRFWDSAEMNLLKALVLYVDLNYPPEQRNIGQVYRLLTECSDTELRQIFEMLPIQHPAKGPFNLFQQASDTVRSGVIIGLGTRLQVFQSQLIRQITSAKEIDLELPGQNPCAYFLVTSDQDSTFDFLASLFLSFVFIKLVRYADRNCKGGQLPVPVHILAEEITACGTISELSRRISVIRSRGISISCVFQNLAGLQNRYPQNQWQEILGNCDIQLFLGCTDPLTAEYVSARTGVASVAVSSSSKVLNTFRLSNYTPEYRETSGVGRRPVLTPDEVLRLPIEEALVIVRGKKVLRVRKMDYSQHPAYRKLRSCKASAHVPAWRAALETGGEEQDMTVEPLPQAAAKPPTGKKKATKTKRPAKALSPKPSDPKPSTDGVVAIDKESILFKP